MRQVYWIIGGCLLTHEQALGMPRAAYKSPETLATALFERFPMDNVSEFILLDVMREEYSARFAAK